MNSRILIFRETLPVAIGQCICAAAMLGAFLLAGRFDSTVLWGGIAGSLISLGNFLLMSFFAGLAADKAAHKDVAEGQKLLRLSYMGRMAGLLAALVICAKSGHFHVLALALPLLFTRPILTIVVLFSRKGGN